MACDCTSRWLVIGVACLCVGAGGNDPALVADAAEQRDLPVVTALLERGLDASARQPDGATALHWAAHWSDLAMTRALVAAGADVNVANDYGVTPLFLAATNGDVDVVGALIDGGADVNASLPTGETVLMRSVRSGRVQAVRRLLAAGADVHAVQTSKGQNALMWAATAGEADGARALIEAGAAVNAQSEGGFTALMFAAREGDLELSRLLLASGADVNAAASTGDTALLVATVRGHAALAVALLEAGASPDGNLSVAGYTPLHWVVARFEHPHDAGELEPPGEWRAMAGIPDREAKLSLIRTLVEHGADVEARITKGLPSPRFGGTGTNSLKSGVTPFFVAASCADVPVMRLLLALGADPLVRAPDGSTVVMGVIGGGSAFTAKRIPERDRIAAIDLALALGVDIEAQDDDGYRAMHVAAGAEFHNVILFLLEKGADLNPVTQSRVRKEGTGFVSIAGQSPLGIVEGTFNGGSYNERPETAAFLRKLGAQSIGRVTLESYLKSLDSEKRPQ